MHARQRFHLNAWYHYGYLILTIVVSWYKTSYYSILHWAFACICLWFKGHKFLATHSIHQMRTIILIHVILTSLIGLQFIGLALLNSEQYIRESLNYETDSILELLASQLFLYLSLMAMQILTYVNLHEPDQDGSIDNDDSEYYSLHQKKVSYLRQQVIMDRIMMLIVLLIALNDGFISFILTCSMICYFVIYFNLLPLHLRYRYQKYLTEVIAYSSILSLFLFILSGQNSASLWWGSITGTLQQFPIFKILGIFHMSIILVLSVRAMQYQEILDEAEMEQVYRQIQNESKEVVSSIGLFLGQNYFGVIMVLSVFWISKQFSILRGAVYILLLLGQLKRYKFKAKKKWQYSIAILYVACLQFLLLYFFNIPLFNGGKLLQYVGVYVLPQFNPENTFALWDFFIARLNVIFLDLSYIITLTWLVYAQQTIEDKRHQKIIDELVNRKSHHKSDFWNNFKVQVSEIFLQIKESTYLHFDEFVIIYCLFTALHSADICRGIFLFYFIVYEFIELNQRREKMRQHLSVGFVMLFTLYTFQLLFLRNLTLLNTIFNYVGLQQVSDSYGNPFYFIYQYYDIIIGCILLTFQIQIIQKTEVYKKYKRDLLEDLSVCDFFRSQLIRNGLIITQTVILIVAFIPSANLFSLVFIVIYQIFLYLYYVHKSQKLVMDKLQNHWKLMITLTLIILLLRYTYTIRIFYEMVEFYFRQPTLFSDIGLNPNFNTLKLLGNGIALMLLCSYRRCYYTLDYQRLHQEEPAKESIFGTWSYFFYSLRIKISVMAVLHIQKVIFIFAFFLSVYQQSYIGLLFACLIFMILAREHRENWQNISVPFLVVLFLQIIIQYLFQAEILRGTIGQETIIWIGIQDQYTSRYWYLLVMFHICELLPLLNSVCKNTIKQLQITYMFDDDREVRHLSKLNKLLQIMKRGFHEVENEKSESEYSIDKNPEIYIIDPFDDRESRYEKLMEYWESQPSKRQCSEFLTVLPFYKTLKTHQQIDRLFTQIGLEVCLFIVVITAYYERNFFSVFYIMVASIFANYSGVLDKRNPQPAIKVYRLAWAIFCGFQMLEVIRKYTILQWTPPSWDVRKPWWYYQYSCAEQGKESFKENDPTDQISDFMKCQSDWNFWLSLEGYNQVDIWINFLSFLVSVCFFRHFDTIERLQQHHDDLTSNRTITFKEESVNDDDDPNDFTYQHNRKRLSDYLKFFVFCYFYKLALIIFLLIGMSSDIASYTEIISSVYFFIAINLLYMSEKLERENTRIWGRLILFNTIVMILMSLYQAPFVKCPIIYEENRYYYDNAECIQIQQQNHYYNSDFFIFLQDEFHLLTNKNTQIQADVFYMFLSHVSGLNKTLDFRFGFNKETLMAFFFLFGLLQRNIWAHPYMKQYVEPYLRRQEKKQKLSAIKLIEGIHLKRIWDFKYVQAQKDVHESLQQRVQERVSSWDKFLYQDHKYEPLVFEDAEQIREQYTDFEAEDYERMKENPRLIIKAEKITQQSVAPVIQLYDACCIVRNSLSEEDLQLRLKKLLLLEERAVLQQVYSNEKIGLIDYYHKVTLQLDQEIDQVQQEIFALNQIQQEDHKSEERPLSDEIQFKEFNENDVSSFHSAEQVANNVIKNTKLTEKTTKARQSKGFSDTLKNLIITILTHDYYMRENELKSQHMDQKQLSALVFIFIAYYFQVVCVILMVVNTCFNANLLALFYPFSALLYGLLENPVPSRKYWNFLIIYTICVISLKFLYQMPIFCDSPPYRFIGFSTEDVCEPRVTTQLEKITRIDFVLGIRKYSAPETFMNMIWIELLLFIALLVQRYLLQSQGIWDHMRLAKDQYFVPQFKEHKQPLITESVSKISEEQQPIIDDFSERAQEHPKSPDMMRKVQILSDDAHLHIVNFWHRLFPSTLSQRLPLMVYDPVEMKMTRQELTMIPEQIKTGRDFYAPGFIVCLLILIYFLLFYPNMIAKRSYAHITQGHSQRFSSEVIFVILIVIAITVIDRMLFITRKQTKAVEVNDFSKYTLIVKVVIHVVLIFTVHYYFFFVIPRKTNKRFQESLYLMMAYLLVCAYFIISAIQIRYGYPIAEITQIFTGSHKTMNSIAFKVYRAIPFLYELRVIIDWTFTSTALDLTQWFRLEDIFANLYICQAYMDQRLKYHSLGEPRKPSEKFTSGFCFALLFIFIIILPILIFSSLNPAVEINNVSQGKFTIKAAFLGAEDKLYFTLFSTNDIELLDIPNDQFKTIQKVYGEIETGWQERMQKVRIKPFSDLEWNLAENYRDQIRTMIKSQNYQVQVSCEWTFYKNDRQGGQKSFGGISTVDAPDTFVNSFGKILAPRAPDAVFDIQGIIPKFLYVGESAETEILRLEPVNIREQNDYNQDIRLIHKKISDQVFFELVPNDNSQDLKTIGASVNNRVEFFILNELAFGSIIGAMSTNVSIIGIYATFVLTIGRILRLTYDKISTRIMFEEMPETHELYDLCQSIYIARVDRNFHKEEIFYELLIRIYRSPEILFKMTGSSIYNLKK